MNAEARAAMARVSPAQRAFVLVQYLLPRRALSALAHRLARSRRAWLKHLLIRGFMRRFGVSLAEAAVQDPAGFENFSAFFTRALAEGARPLPAEPEAIVSPADGCLYHAAVIDGERMLQAKGQHYSLRALLAGHPRCREFSGATALTIYLAPGDYHRVHMPLDGRLAVMSHVPGDLFSVNAATARQIPGLFARNERVVCLFDTAIGPVALVMIGALNVGSIHTVWAGEVTAWGPREPTHHAYAAQGEGSVRLARGEMLGGFDMGSTVILILPSGRCRLADGLTPGQRLRMGQTLATMID